MDLILDGSSKFRIHELGTNIQLRFSCTSGPAMQKAGRLKGLYGSALNSKAKRDHFFSSSSSSYIYIYLYIYIYQVILSTC